MRGEREPTLSEILTELKRERAMRDHVFPGLVRSKKLDPAVAARRNKCLDAAIAVVGRQLAAERAAAAAAEGS